MRYLALLRGINVGGNNKVDMKKLKLTFERVGFQDVRTYINSGNIICSSSSKDKKTIENTIETAIKKDFSLSIHVVVKSKADMKKITEAIPTHWTNDKEQKSDVMFLWDEVDTKIVLKELDIKKGIDTVLYVPGAVLWSVDRIHQAKSGMKDIVGTKLYKQMTVRNVNTVRKVWELMQ